MNLLPRDAASGALLRSSSWFCGRSVRTWWLHFAEPAHVGFSGRHESNTVVSWWQRFVLTSAELLVACL